MQPANPMKSGKFSNLQTSLLVLYFAVAVGIWSYFSINGRILMEIDQFVKFHSFKSSNLTKSQYKSNIFGRSEQPFISFVWLKDGDEFQAHQFYVLDSYLRQYPNARIQVYATKLPGNFFSEFSQMNYSISVVPITADLFKQFSKSCAFLKDWINNRFSYRQQSSYYDDYLMDFLKGCLLYQYGGIVATFDTFLLNPISKFFNQNEFIFDSLLQFIAATKSAQNSAIIKASMLKNFTKSDNDLINSKSNLAEIIKQEALKHQQAVCIDNLIALNSTFLVPTTDKHQFVKTCQLLTDFHLALSIVGAIDEELLLDENNPFSLFLFRIQLFNRQEDSESYIQTTNFLVRDLEFERKYLKQLNFPAEHLWTAAFHDFGIVPGYGELGARKIELTLQCKNCDGFSIASSDSIPISARNPLQLTARNMKDLNMQLPAIRVVVNNNTKNESMIITATVSLNEKSKSAAFPLYNASNEITIVTFKHLIADMEHFLKTVKTFSTDYKEIKILIGIWKNDSSLAENFSLQPIQSEEQSVHSEDSAGNKKQKKKTKREKTGQKERKYFMPSIDNSQISAYEFDADTSVPVVLNNLISRVESENFLFVNPSFYSYKGGDGILEKLIFQMNSFDIAGVEPINLSKKTHNFGYGNFYKNSADRCLKIKAKAFKEDEDNEVKFSQCFTVNYTGPFFISKTFLFKDLLLFDRRTFKSPNDWGYLEDLFLTMKKKQEINIGTCPIALVPRNKTYSCAELSSVAFFHKHTAYDKVVAFGRIVAKKTPSSNDE